MANEEMKATARGDSSPDEEAANIVALVGARVRQSRADAGISRRILSERSGVSQRYLAQLEQGDGNVSIALLHKIANALGTDICRLTAEECLLETDALEIATLFAHAPPEDRQKVAATLDKNYTRRRRAQRIALIGMRGAGKSTLGRLTGDNLNLNFVELNDEIEKTNGMPVEDTFALYGQEGYRLMERRALERIAETTDQLILAIAGGIVSEPETFEFLLNHYHTIWLKASPQEHMDRVRAQGDERPMAGNPAAMDELKNILTSREALYAKADVTVDTSGANLKTSLRDVTTAITDHGFLSESL